MLHSTVISQNWLLPWFCTSEVAKKFASSFYLKRIKYIAPNPISDFGSACAVTYISSLTQANGITLLAGT